MDYNQENENKISMSKLLKEAYHEYAISHHTFGNPNGKTLLEQLDSVRPMQHSKESFFNKIKTDKEFANHWGVEITERKLSLEERNYTLGIDKAYLGIFGMNEMDDLEYKELFDKENRPTKLTTITYNGQTEEIYE